MDRDKIKGSATQAKGAVKEAFGKATGNKKIEAEGLAEKAGGKAQSTFGSIKDSVRDVFKK